MRTEFEGGIYRVDARRNARQKIVRDDTDRRRDVSTRERWNKGRRCQAEAFPVASDLRRPGRMKKNRCREP